MENLDLELNVKVNTQSAVEGLDTLQQKAKETADTVGDIGKKAEESVSKVSGLGNAFEGVFSMVLQEGGKVKGTLGDTFKSVKQAIPTVKKLNSTAISGLTGIKRALASIGLGTIIGTVITAIGLIVTHWEGFLVAIGSSKEKFDEFKSKALDAIGNVIIGITGVGNVIVQLLAGPVKRAITAIKGIGQAVRQLTEKDFKGALETAKNTVKELGDSFTKQFDIKGSFEDGKKVGKKLVEGFTTMMTYKAPEVEKTGEELGNKFGKGFEKGTKDLVEDLIEELKASVKDFEDSISDGIDLADSLISKAKRLNDLENERKEVLEEIERQGGWAPSGFVDQAAERLLDYGEQYDLLEKTLISVADRWIDLKALKMSWEEMGLPTDEIDLQIERLQDYRNQLKAAIDISESFLDNELPNIASEAIKSSLELGKSIDTEFFEHMKSLSSLLGDESVDWEEERLKATKQYLEEEQKLYSENSLEYQKTALEIQSIDDQILEHRISVALKNKELQDKEKEELKKYLVEEAQMLADAAQSIASIYGMMAEKEENRIRELYEQGKISEELANQQFEQVKKWQLAENWINTLAGMTAAFASPILNSTPAGWIAAGARAAALLANGLIQDKKIRETKIGDGATGGGGAGTSAPVGVTPIQVGEDIQASPTVLQSSQSPRDQRVYILEGDIQDSNKRVEVREANSTF